MHLICEDGQIHPSEGFKLDGAIVLSLNGCKRKLANIKIL